ncbi:MAG: NAD(P)/FAD-dependent oxidoreductase, partial [Armatimonadota bacterium]
MLDLLIIGGGPAGMTAAIYAARKQLSVTIISPEIGGQTAWANDVENYLGYRFIKGYELAQKFEEHMRDFGIKHIMENVTSLVKQDNMFNVSTEIGNTYDSKAVIVASGRSARKLGVPGEDEFKGKGVAYCATCDAPLFAGEDVVVAGGGNAGLGAAVQLQKIANKVYVIESMGKLTCDPVLQSHIKAASNVETFINTEITSINGTAMMESVSIRDIETGKESTIPATGIFIEIGSSPNIAFLPKEVEVTSYNEIMIDCANHTNIPGLFAAGDVTNVPGKQIIIAAGEGAKSLLSVYDYILHLL